MIMAAVGLSCAAPAGHVRFLTISRIESSPGRDHLEMDHCLPVLDRRRHPRKHFAEPKNEPWGWLPRNRAE